MTVEPSAKPNKNEESMSTLTVDPKRSASTSPTQSAGPDLLVERQRKRRRDVRFVWTVRVILAIVVLGGWQLASAENWIDPLLISSPGDVAKAIGDQITQPSFWTDVKATFSGAISGLAVGAVLGILVGVLFARWPLLDRAFKPFLTLVNSLPRPALAPVFIMWFGLGVEPKIFVAASVVFFVLLTTTVSALQTINDDILQLTDSLAMSPRQRFTKIEFPAALPGIVGGLRLGAVYAVLGCVVSEMVGATHGLGQRLVQLTNNFKVADSFAVLLAMAVMSMVLDYAISGLGILAKNRTR